MPAAAVVWLVKVAVGCWVVKMVLGEWKCAWSRYFEYTIHGTSKNDWKTNGIVLLQCIEDGQLPSVYVMMTLP